MSERAAGIFDVQLHSTPADEYADGALGRMTIDKNFHGDLEATSKGQMLSAMTGEKGSAGYVAIEKVDGSLKGLPGDRKSTRLNSSHRCISYAVFCLKKKKNDNNKESV